MDDRDRTLETEAAALAAEWRAYITRSFFHWRERDYDKRTRRLIATAEEAGRIDALLPLLAIPGTRRDSDVCEELVEALSHGGPDIVAPLILAANDKEEGQAAYERQSKALDALGEVPLDVRVAGVLAILRDDDTPAHLRTLAVDELGRGGPDVLVYLEEHDDLREDPVVQRCLGVLDGYFYEPDVGALPSFVRELVDIVLQARDGQERDYAYDALRDCLAAHHGRLDDETLTELRRLPDEEVVVSLIDRAGGPTLVPNGEDLASFEVEPLVIVPDDVQARLGDGSWRLPPGVTTDDVEWWSLTVIANPARSQDKEEAVQALVASGAVVIPTLRQLEADSVAGRWATMALAEFEARAARRGMTLDEWVDEQERLLVELTRDDVIDP